MKFARRIADTRIDLRALMRQLTPLKPLVGSSRRLAVSHQVETLQKRDVGLPIRLDPQYLFHSVTGLDELQFSQPGAGVQNGAAVREKMQLPGGGRVAALSR
jgi:hypothetical protein